MYWHHRNELDLRAAVGTEENESPAPLDPALCSPMIPEDAAPQACPSAVPRQEICAGMLKNFSYLMLKYTGKYQIPHNIADNLIKDIVTVTEHSQELVYHSLKQSLLGLGIDTDVHSTLQEILNRSILDGVRQHLFTTHGRLEHAKASFNYVAPSEHKLGLDKFYTVSVSEILKVLLESPDHVQEALQNRQPRADDIMEDFCDGSLFNTTASFSGTNAILLQLYSDEFDVVNPWVQSGEHTKLCVYFSIMNVSPKNRSKFDNIHMFLLSPYIYVKNMALYRY